MNERKEYYCSTCGMFVAMQRKNPHLRSKGHAKALTSPARLVANGVEAMLRNDKDFVDVRSGWFDVYVKDNVLKGLVVGKDSLGNYTTVIKKDNSMYVLQFFATEVKAIRYSGMGTDIS